MDSPPKPLISPPLLKTVSHIASVTKSFTATAIGELVAEGKVDWNKTPVSEYLPEFQLKDPVLTSQLTFSDMLAHRTVGTLMLRTLLILCHLRK